MTTTTIHWSHLEEILVAKRPRLLGLCTYLTGDPDSAEDILQEVMLEAWRSCEKLRDPTAMTAWLNGIVRNVCARWQRTRGRDAVVMLPAAQRDVDVLVEIVADGIDHPKVISAMFTIKMICRHAADLLESTPILLPLPI